MRVAGILVFVCLIMTACDDQRIYENYVDFENRYWLVDEKPSFEFSISDTTTTYNVYSNVRNSVSYPWSRLFVNYSLADSTGTTLRKHLMNEFLFDASSGEPFGNSGLGDIYDHQFLLLKDYQFKKPGKYVMTFEQFMRTDTLQGVLAVGLRIERSPEKK
jgi:gliding motility-associated lipoprotein GldH